MSFRSDVRAALVTRLEAVKAANPTALRKVYLARPAAIAEHPVAWVGTITERFQHTSGVRTRLPGTVATVIIATILTDNAETLTKVDDAAGLVIDDLTANYHALSSDTVIEPIGSESVEIPYGDTAYPGVEITVSIIEASGRT